MSDNPSELEIKAKTVVRIRGGEKDPTLSLGAFKRRGILHNPEYLQLCTYAQKFILHVAKYIGWNPSSITL